MVLKPVVTSLDEIGEAIRAEYSEGDDGRFYLQVEQIEGYSLENVDSLKSTLAKQKRQIADQKKKLEALEDLPDDVREQLEELEVLREQGGEGDEKHQAQIKQLIDKHKAEVEKIKAEVVAGESRIGQLKTSIQEGLKTRTATQALADAGANVELLLPHVVGRMKVIESEEDKYSVVFLDAKGEEMVTKKHGSLDPMGADEYVEVLKKDEKFQPAFAGSGKSGGGANGGDDKKRFAGVNPWAVETTNITEQGKIMRDDPELAKRLKQEAGVA